MTSEYNEIIIPDLGLFSHYPPEAVPRKMGGDGFMHIGWSYCRNVSLSRKEGCIKKSLGTEKFSASATGATDSVRGIGILNKHARPNNYELSTIKKVVASADDCYVETPSTFDNSGNFIYVGQDDLDDFRHGACRFPGWTIAKSTQIISAVLKLSVRYWHNGSSDGKVKIRIKAHDVNDSTQISDYADFIDRKNNAATTAYFDKDVTIPKGELGVIETFDVTEIIQELVNSNAYSNQAIQLLLIDNNSVVNQLIGFTSYDAGLPGDYAELEIVTNADIPTQPTYFLYVKGASAGELWKLNSNKVPSEVTQSGESYASSYQSQTAKFLQYGNDLLVTDDGKNDATQQWDISENPSEFEDVAANFNGRYIEEFKARVWLVHSLISGTIYKQRIYYSDTNDQTTYSAYALLPGSDAPTAVIKLTQDELIVFKEGSTVRIVDVETTASDYRPYIISSKDGSLGANVVSDGARIYGINERGVFQWPVSGFPNGFRYISKPIQDEIDKITLDKMNLVWFAYDPKHRIHMHFPNTGYSRNTLDAVFNITKDTWENISDIWEANIMIDGFDTDGNPMMFFGQEDGYLKNIGGDDDEGSNFTGRIDTGALWMLDNQKRLISRTLLGIEPVTNYESSYTLNFYYKVYDRPGDESSASWNGAYTHASSVKGNEEIVPIIPGPEGKYHIIRIDGTVKDEPFEILGLKLRWKLGSPT